MAHEPLATLVLTEQFEMGIARFFHWRAAVDGWACVVSHRAPLPPNATQIEISGADVFFLEQHASGHSTFYPHVIAQLLLRPIRPLRAAVETIIADYRGGYDGLHLRTLDRGPKACSAVWVTPEALRCQCVKSYNVTVDDICHMEPRYVRAALGVLGEPAANQSRPLLIAHDRSYDARVAELVHEFGGVDLAEQAQQHERGRIHLDRYAGPHLCAPLHWKPGVHPRVQRGRGASRAAPARHFEHGEVRLQRAAGRNLSSPEGAWGERLPQGGIAGAPRKPGQWLEDNAGQLGASSCYSPLFSKRSAPQPYYRYCVYAARIARRFRA